MTVNRLRPRCGHSSGMNRILNRLLQATTVLGLSGCAAWLPHGRSETPGGFESFEQAREATESVRPLATRVAELPQLGFDTRQGTNSTLVPYPEIVGRLTPHPGVPLELLDPGIRRCIAAQTACRGYLFRFERQRRVREGSFWLDFFNLRRTITISGWWFEALIVVDGETVLFRNYGGQPRTDRIERQTNPLGPLQPAGEAAGSLLLR